VAGRTLRVDVVETDADQDPRAAPQHRHGQCQSAGAAEARGVVGNGGGVNDFDNDPENDPEDEQLDLFGATPR